MSAIVSRFYNFPPFKDGEKWATGTDATLRLLIRNYIPVKTRALGLRPITAGSCHLARKLAPPPSLRLHQSHHRLRQDQLCLISQPGGVFGKEIIDQFDHHKMKALELLMISFLFSANQDPAVRGLGTAGTPVRTRRLLIALAVIGYVASQWKKFD
jgi:hypothetical protein